MTNNERTRAAAEAALETYRTHPGMDSDDDTIADLIADLAHVADQAGMEGSDVLGTARDHYLHERHEQLSDLVAEKHAAGRMLPDDEGEGVN